MSIPTVNNPVVALGTPLQTGTTKLSIISEQKLAGIPLNFHSANSCFAICQTGECNAMLMNKKKVSKSISIQQYHSVWGNIQT